MFNNIKIRLYPTLKQMKVLEDHFNGYRYCYNLCLEYKSMLWNDYRLNVSGFEMQKELFQIRKENDWLLKCKAECIREAALNVEKSYKKFFKGSGFPKFKNKKGVQSFTANESNTIKNNKLSFYKNKIKFRTSEKYHTLLQVSKIKRVIFKKDLCGDYWATCLIEIPEVQSLPSNNNSVGIDLGLKHLLITSDGEYFENKRFLQNSYFKHRSLQRKFSKSKKGGKNREKLRIKLAKSFRKISNQKSHYYHQIVNKLISDNQTIIIEDLAVKNMIKNHKIAKSISDVSWGFFMNILEEKCCKYGRHLIKINRWFPSSKTCSNCGSQKAELSLAVRVYKCESCSIEIDRDLNASLNIKQEGLRISGLSVEDYCNSKSYEAESKI